MGPPGPTLSGRLSGFFHRHPWFRVVLLLSPGLLWLVVAYLGSLGALVLQSLYRLEEFTGLVVRDISLETYGTLFDRANLDIIIRSTLMAAAVTVACGVLAFPVANYMARYASPRMKALLTIGVLMPLWANYLVRVYSWKLILARNGVFSWFVEHLGLGPVLNWVLGVPSIGGPSLSQSFIGMFLVFVYVWLPFMILPLSAALERVPDSFVEASSDLGARPGMTFRRVVLPLALPGLVAGSIFTFSLTLGDFIIPTYIGNSSYFIGATVYTYQSTAANFPLAAAFAVVPMVIMGLYLWGARRIGAFEAI